MCDMKLGRGTLGMDRFKQEGRQGDGKEERRGGSAQGFSWRVHE